MTQGSQVLLWMPAEVFERFGGSPTRDACLFQASPKKRKVPVLNDALVALRRKSAALTPLAARPDFLYSFSRPQGHHSEPEPSSSRYAEVPDSANNNAPQLPELRVEQQQKRMMILWR